jgi:hypothetical protein
VSTGEPCTIRIEPAKGRPYNCRLVIRCGSHVLFGFTKTNGYAHCTVDAGMATSAHESEPNDSDPDVHYDAATGRATVKEVAWQVDLEIVRDDGSAR